MKHRFSLVYELDVPVAQAVAAYLDAEHYIFLHRKYLDRIEILDSDPVARRIVYRMSWKLLGLRVGQRSTAEYLPPAGFKNYDVRPEPWWFPSIHHLVSTTTLLRYTPIEGKDATLSTLEVELDLPFWLYPFRSWIQKAISKLKVEKDQEDLDMLTRRARLFGRNELSVYLAPQQFLLYKEDFVKHFGAVPPSAPPARVP